MAPHPKHMTSLFALMQRYVNPKPAKLIGRARPVNHAIGIQYPVNLMIEWDYLALLSYGKGLSGKRRRDALAPLIRSFDSTFFIN